MSSRTDGEFMEFDPAEEFASYFTKFIQTKEVLQVPDALKEQSVELTLTDPELAKTFMRGSSKTQVTG